jgi:hypothetical protein
VGGDEPHLRRHRRANHSPVCRGRSQAILRPPRCQGEVPVFPIPVSLSPWILIQNSYYANLKAIKFFITFYFYTQMVLKLINLKINMKISFLYESNN